jgi:hypothetical protein
MTDDVITGKITLRQGVIEALIRMYPPALEQTGSSPPV